MGTDQKVLLVGMDNPYSDDPRNALYPLPVGASGDRLCRAVLGLDHKTYLRHFDRVNLCPGAWSMPVARETASRLAAERTRLVLLGAKVSSAFGLTVDAFSAGTLPGGAQYVQLPHPSGLSRAWNVRGSEDRARKLMRDQGWMPDLVPA